MYSRNDMLSAIGRVCRDFGFRAYGYESFDLDLDTTTFNIKIEDRYKNEIDTIKINPLSFNEEYLDKLRDKLSNKASEKSIPTKAILPPNLCRSYLGLDPIIPFDKDKQIVKVLEGKSVIIQFDSLLKKETLEALKEYIQNQIKENGFAVVDGKCKIVEFDNPKYLIETK